MIAEVSMTSPGFMGYLWGAFLILAIAWLLVHLVLMIFKR